MGSSCKGSDHTILRGGRGTGIVAEIEVGVSRFSEDRSGIVRLDDDIHVGKDKGFRLLMDIRWRIEGRQLRRTFHTK